MDSGIKLGDIQQVLLKNGTYTPLSKGTTEESPSVSQQTETDDIPLYSADLLVKLEKIFKDTLPPVELYAEHPESIWIRYGQQDVLRWIRCRLKGKKT